MCFLAPLGSVKVVCFLRQSEYLGFWIYQCINPPKKLWQMDRASILGDAIEYLKELLQRIADIHNELEAAKMEHRSLPSSPSGALTPGTTQVYPMVKEECPVLPNPESQPPRVS